MRSALPYVVPGHKGIEFGPWRTHEGLDLPPVWEGWDSASTIRVERFVTVDLDEIRRACGLADDVPLRAGASWRSSTSTMTLPAGAVDITTSGSHRLVAVLDGNRVGGHLRIRTTVTVARAWDAPPGIAGRAGSVLAEDDAMLAVEGDEPLFPTEVVDFASTAWDPDASWHLTVESDPDLPFLGACWLSINSRDTELVKAVSATKRTQRQEALIEAMHSDVGDQLLEAAETAEHDHGLTEHDWPDGSLGAALLALLTHRGEVPLRIEGLGATADRRTARQGAVRRMGMGRRFR